MLDAVIGALFPYTFFGDACRHLFWNYLSATLDPADDPISAASYYPIWPRGPRQRQSENLRDIYRAWKMDGRCLDLTYLTRKQMELGERPVMGQASHKPKYLATKLLAIRQTERATQSWVANLLRVPHCSQISDYERGRRIPNLSRLVHYSKIAGVPLEHIVDDEFDLVKFYRELALAKRARELFCELRS